MINEVVEWAEGLSGPQGVRRPPGWFDGRWITWYLDRFAPLPLYGTGAQRGSTIGAIELPTC